LILCPHRCDEWLDADDVHDAGEIVDSLWCLAFEKRLERFGEHYRLFFWNEVARLRNEQWRDVLEVRLERIGFRRLSANLILSI
jgi:hypothetical protein